MKTATTNRNAARQRIRPHRYEIAALADAIPARAFCNRWRARQHRQPPETMAS